MEIVSGILDYTGFGINWDWVKSLFSDDEEDGNDAIDIGIGLDDPNTNWDGGNHGGQHIDSPLIDVLGDVNPEFNASEDIGTNFVQLMAPSGNDFF